MITIALSQITSMRTEVCFLYFTRPELLSRWLSDAAAPSEYFDDTLYLAWGQDHFVAWRFKELHKDKIVIQQLFMGEPDLVTEILVEFINLGDQTEVKITQTGVTPDMETTYREDWSGLQYLATPRPPRPQW